MVAIVPVAVAVSPGEWRSFGWREEKMTLFLVTGELRRSSWYQQTIVKNCKNDSGNKSRGLRLECGKSTT